MSTLSPRQMFLLDLACQPLADVFDRGVFLVGTATAPRGERLPRDIDVRAIVRDKRWDRLAKAIGRDGIAFLGLAIGQYLASITGLPIDFQIQRMTEANELHKGMRNPLGHRSMRNFEGDTPVAPARSLSTTTTKEESND